MSFGYVGKEEDYMSYVILEVYKKVVDYFFYFVEDLSMVYEYCIVISNLQIHCNRVTTVVRKFWS